MADTATEHPTVPSTTTTPVAPPRPQVLFVDDDVALLDSIRRQLRRRFDVHVASSGAEAFEIVERSGPFSVVVSDMQMPVLDGAAVLRRMRELSADTVRMLLTGYADVDAAISAVNDGRIFRFLCKPCSPETLIAALDGAVEQHRLVTAERELLEETLQGSIGALLETLALANPTAFARALRVRGVVSELIDRMEVPDRWQIEVACMLAQLGAVTLPPHVADQLHRGVPLAAADQELVDRMPDLAAQLLAKVPRLEEVRAIIAGHRRTNRDLASMPLGAHVLRVAIDFDTLQARGQGAPAIVSTFRNHTNYYDAGVVDALEAMWSGRQGRSDTTTVSIDALETGMVLAGDIRRADGMLLVGRGQGVTPGLLERLRNFAARSELQDQVEVLVPDEVGS